MKPSTKLILETNNNIVALCLKFLFDIMTLPEVALNAPTCSRAIQKIAHKKLAQIEEIAEASTEALLAMKPEDDIEDGNSK